MLNFIQVAISRVIDKLKVYFQKKSSPEKFYSSIKNKPIAEQERELDRLTKYILKTKDKKYYQNLLSVLVPSLDLNIEQSDFDAFGIGGSSLNTFRKITFGNEVYFEKVYFNSSIDLQRIVWFQYHVFPLIKGQIKSSEIVKKYKGELVTIIYFNYLELKALKSDEKEEHCIELSKILYVSTSQHRSQLEELSLPDFITDYKCHFQYERNTRVKPELLNVDVEEIERKIDKTKRVFTHGDIQKTNVFQNSILIDWDTFGIYPIGFDVAFIFFRLLVDGKKESDFFNWLEKYYKTSIDKEDWEDFKMNSTYFLYIFSIILFAKGHYKELKKELEIKLKEL